MATKKGTMVESQTETPTDNNEVAVQDEVIEVTPLSTQQDEVIEVTPLSTQQDEVIEVTPLSTQQEKIDKYLEYTGLKLDPNCHMDMEFVELWYQTKYLTKTVYKWAMKPGARIVHYGDGVVYKAANMTDEIAVRLIKENPAYAEQFVQIN